MSTSTLALWDEKTKRAATLKEQLDMFAPEDSEATLLPLLLHPPVEHHNVVFLSFDECGELALNAVRAVRLSSDMTFLMLIGNRKSDFHPFFRPKIKPCGVLFHPVQTSQLREMLDEIDEEMERLTESESNGILVIKSEGVTYRISYRDILFIEASNKQVVLHTAGQVICYYESLDNLIAVLPPYFFRCHRGYIVNIRKIEEIRCAEMELKLTGGYRVPLSRKRRDALTQAISIKHSSTKLRIQKDTKRRGD